MEQNFSVKSNLSTHHNTSLTLPYLNDFSYFKWQSTQTRSCHSRRAFISSGGKKRKRVPGPARWRTDSEDHRWILLKEQSRESELTFWTKYTVQPGTVPRKTCRYESAACFKPVFSYPSSKLFQSRFFFTAPSGNIVPNIRGLSTPWLLMAITLWL